MSALLFIALLCCLVSCSGTTSRAIRTNPGPEDLALAKSAAGPVLLASTASRHMLFKKPGSKGRVEWLDLRAPADRMTVLYEAPQKDFRPIGIHVLPDARSDDSLEVHVANGIGNVTTLQFQGDKLLSRTTTPHSDLLRGINGITVASDGSIYVSTFGPWPAKDRPKVGAPTPPDQPTKNALLHFRAKERGGEGVWKIVAHGFGGANGLALTPCEKYLLVCSYYGKAVHAFARNTATGALTDGPSPAREGLGFHPDNLKAIGGGEFTVAGQRSWWRAAAHLTLGLPTASGGGERFYWQAGNAGRQTADYTPLLRADLRAPAVVIPVGSQLYVGHIMNRNLRVIDLPKATADPN